MLATLALVENELRAAGPAWYTRYDARPPTVDECQASAKLQPHEVIESGQPGVVIDGGYYAKALYPRTRTPVIVITSAR